MSFAFRPDETSPRVAALLSDLGIAPGGLDLAIDEHDEMLGFLVEQFERDRDRALYGYFRSGASIAESLGQVLRWHFGSLDRISRLLDFASGYGRVTRFLTREIPPARVWVADVYDGGVRFQEERFGVHGLASAVRPEDFACAERFDAVLVTSLFTHLPEERFVAWLRVLLGLLAPGGMLVFSAHSPLILPPDVAMPESGIYFQPTSESGSLAKSDYGSTWVAEAFVRAALDRAGAAGASLHRLERGLCNFQDLYLVLLEPGVDFSALAFQSEPHVVVERVALLDGGRRLQLEGWAAVRIGAVRAVEVRLDREPVVTAPVDGPRPDVAATLGSERYGLSGWGCSCPLPAGISHGSALLRLGAVDGRGVSQPLWSGSIDLMLLTGSRMEVQSYWVALRKVESLRAMEGEQTALERERAAREIEALRARVAAMESSRFWKLRNAWFRIKRALGLTTEP